MCFVKLYSISLYILVLLCIVPPGLEFWDLMSVLLMVQEITQMEGLVNVKTPWIAPQTPTSGDIRALDFVTMAQYLYLDRTPIPGFPSRDWVTNLAAALIQISCQALLSAEANEMSVLYFLWYCCCDNGFLNAVNDEKGGPQQYFLKEGFNAVLTKWSEKIKEKFIFNTPVTSIDSSTPQQIKVTTEHGQVYIAKQVILAITPRAIAETINFNPPLDDNRKLVIESNMGRTIKCQVFYKTQWWNDSYAQKYAGYSGN